MWIRPLRLLCLVCAALAQLTCAGPPTTEEGPPRGRLPRNALPTRYALDLEMVPGMRTFSGEVVIDLELEARVRTIWLHAEDLEVTRVLVRAAGESASLARWDPDPDGRLAAIRLPKNLGPGPASLQIRYRGEIGRRLDGVYGVREGGDDYIFTQFQPIAARRAFPGFDEPSFKTPFELTLTVPHGHVAIGNSPALSEERDPSGRRRIRFAPTPPLPTYLVAWAVGPFDVVETPLPPSAEREHTLPFRGLAPRGRGPELRFALDHTGALLESLERYFGSPYPFAKLDVIAVPDFGAGAMENVGAVTFRDSLLLIDRERAPEWQRRSFANVMAHELAHSWFGNLVTMPWWDDLWLNESFATWMAHRVVNEIHPEYQEDLSLLQQVHSAMSADSLESARSIRQPIASDHDIANAFDGITYSKGAGVLAMFERWLGEESFRAGIRSYVEEHRFGNADADDLLRALSAASGRDVSGPFQGFLTRPGVPFLRTQEACDASGSRIAVEQSRYRPAGAAAAADEPWQVPACVRFSANGETRERCSLVSESRAELSLDPEACSDWVLPNADGAGYYRFAGSARDAERLVGVSDGRLAAAERLALADSLAASFRAGVLGPDVVLPAQAVFARDPLRRVATAPMGLLDSVLENLTDDATRDTARAFAASLYAPRLRELGFDAEPGDDGERRLLRSALIRFLAQSARDPAARAEAARRGLAYAGVEGPPDRTAADPDVVGVTLAVAVQDGAPAVFDALLARLLVSNDSLERRDILEALGSSLDPDHAERARALALDRRVRVNEMFVPLYAQMGEGRLRDATWLWIVENHEALIERAGASHAGHMPWLAAAYCDDVRADEVEAFFAPFVYDLEGGPRNLAGAVEGIRLCAALTAVQGPAVRAWLAERAGSVRRDRGGAPRSPS
jgi:alanyl aminopeptidase